jgi:hypothetical protein
VIVVTLTTKDNFNDIDNNNNNYNNIIHTNVDVNNKRDRVEIKINKKNIANKAVYKILCSR